MVVGSDQLETEEQKEALRYKVHQRHLVDLKNEVGAVAGYLKAYEKSLNEQNQVRAPRQKKELKKALHQVSVMTQVMKLTTQDDEIYGALTNTLNQLIQEFENEFAGVQNQECVTFRDNCAGMLALDQ